MIKFKNMILSAYLLSLSLLFLGWLYYAKPGRVQKINAFFRLKVFNDKYILIKRKKIAVMFFLAALLLFLSAFTRSYEKNEFTKTDENIILEEIILDALASYAKALTSAPDNTHVLIKRARAFEALDEKNKASSAWKAVLEIDPENETAKRRLNVK